MKKNDCQLLRYFLLWLVLPFIVAHCFYGIFGIWEKSLKLLASIFLPLFLFHIYSQVASIFTFFFKLISQVPINELILLNRSKKFTCDNCGTETTKLNQTRQKKSCLTGTLLCTHCPNFFTKYQNDLNYHFAKKRSAPKPDVTFKCKL